MDDEQSPAEVVETTAEETPVTDPLLSTLSDTEDASDDEVVETPKEEVAEAETEPEVEQPTEEQEEVETPDPKEEARRRYEERQAYREAQRTKIAEQTQEYTAEATDEYDQRLRAMEVQRYQELIENTQDKLVNEFERAKSNPDLQIFNPDSDEFNQRAYDKALKDFNSGYITYDSNDNMVGLKGSLYEHLTETAELLKGAVKSGQVQQVRATQRMKSKSDVKPAATPKEIKGDPLMDILLSD